MEQTLGQRPVCEIPRASSKPAFGPELSCHIQLTVGTITKPHYLLISHEQIYRLS